MNPYDLNPFDAADCDEDGVQRVGDVLAWTMAVAVLARWALLAAIVAGAAFAGRFWNW